MKPAFFLALTPVAAAALLAGCASSDPATRATVQCEGLARSEGLSIERSGVAQPAGDGYEVTMKVADRVGRRIDASCAYAQGSARWAQPLPAGLATR